MRRKTKLLNSRFLKGVAIFCSGMALGWESRPLQAAESAEPMHIVSSDLSSLTLNNLPI